MNANHVPGPRLGPADTVGTRQASPVVVEFPLLQGQQATNEKRINKQESI